MLHNEEERIFDQKKSCFATLCETMWTLPVDDLAWLLIHYEQALDILQETSGQSDATSYK